MTHHGGDIYRNKVDIDFSVSINPYPLPQSIVGAMENALERAGQYPDLRQERLRSALAEHYGILPEQIVCGNGASELLMAVFHAIQPEQTILWKVDYGGYRRCAEAVGSEVVQIGRQTFAGERVKYQQDKYSFVEKQGNFCQTEYDGLQNVKISSVENTLFVFSLPNNPTGKLLKKDVLEQYFQYCKSNNFWLIIDASFLDLTKQANDYWKILLKFIRHYDRCIVISSFTKSFALPGIRIGYMFCTEMTAGQIRRQLPEWNVSVVAEEAGIACLSEWGYLKECVGKIVKERQRVSDALREFGFQVYDSDANFVFFQSELSLYEPLLQKGILIRDCADFSGKKNHVNVDGLQVKHNANGTKEPYSYRIAIRTPEENDRLLKIINEHIMA